MSIPPGADRVDLIAAINDGHLRCTPLSQQLGDSGGEAVDGLDGLVEEGGGGCKSLSLESLPRLRGRALSGPSLPPVPLV
jgi:hypothetical protein